MRKLVLATAIGLAGLLTVTASAMANTFNVWPGQSIQKAVNRAHAGDTVLVHRGTYHQVVTIHKSGIHLVGLRATILPPAHPGGLCTQFSAPQVSGICVLGWFDAQGNPLPTRARNNSISGFRVMHFSGEGIFLANVRNTRVTHNISAYNGDYGIVGFDQVGGAYLWNISHDNASPGFYLGDSPNAGYVIAHNVTYRNQFGIFVRHTAHALVTDNRSWGNCVGVLLLNDAQPGGEHNLAVTHNRVWANNKACAPDDEGGPAVSGIGVLLVGTTSSIVADNTILNNAPSGPTPFSGGLVLVSNVPFGGTTNTTNVHVFGNTLHGNSPLDVLWDGQGTGNTFTNNTCSTSSPSSIC